MFTKMKTKITCFSLLLLLSTTVFADKIYQFATDATYPPFVYMDNSGQVQGFETELLQLMCQQQNLSCQFVHQPFDSLIISLKIGKFDGIYGGFDITDERKKQVIFSEPLYPNSASFISLDASGFTRSTMYGKQVGVQQGSTFQTFLQKQYGKKISIKPYASIQDAFLDLKSGRIQAVFGDTAIVQDWQIISTVPTTIETLSQDEGGDFFGHGYALAMSLKNKELLDKFNQSFCIIQKNGQLDKLKQKYKLTR